MRRLPLLPLILLLGCGGGDGSPAVDATAADAARDMAADIPAEKPADVVEVVDAAVDVGADARADDGPDAPGTAGETADGAVDGVSCTSDGECAAGTFCNRGYVFGSPSCVPLLENGQFSLVASHCRSGLRARNRCVDRAVCAADGAPCLDSAHCCNQATGSICLESACFVPLPDGERCWQDQMCRTGRCTFGRCGLANACVPAGDSCVWDLECCAGAFCDHSAAMASNRCATLRPAGAPCARSAECASKACSGPPGVCQ